MPWPVPGPLFPLPQTHSLSGWRGLAPGGGERRGEGWSPGRETGCVQKDPALGLMSLCCNFEMRNTFHGALPPDPIHHGAGPAPRSLPKGARLTALHVCSSQLAGGSEVDSDELVLSWEGRASGERGHQ